MYMDMTLNSQTGHKKWQTKISKQTVTTPATSAAKCCRLSAEAGLDAITTAHLNTPSPKTPEDQIKKPDMRVSQHVRCLR